MPNKYLDSVGLAEYTRLVKTALDTKLSLSGGTMTGLIISNTNPSIDATSATQVEESVTRGVDKNGLTLGQNFYSAYSNDVFNAFRATNPNYNSGTNWADLRLHVDKDGKSWINFERHGSVTDGTADNSTHIPTTAWLHNNYLPLTGGTMTGRIHNNSTVFVDRPNDTGELLLFSGTEGGNYPVIALRGKNRSSEAGSFFIRAVDANSGKTFMGKPDGALTWGGKEIERVNASGTNYIRYESGLQICWGDLAVSGEAVSDATATLPQAFKSSTSYNIVTGRFWAYSKDENYIIKSMTATNFVWSTIGTVTTNSHSYRYIAIGFWK